MFKRFFMPRHPFSLVVLKIFWSPIDLYVGIYASNDMLNLTIKINLDLTFLQAQRIAYHSRCRCYICSKKTSTHKRLKSGVSIFCSYFFFLPSHGPVVVKNRMSVKFSNPFFPSALCSYSWEASCCCCSFQNKKVNFQGASSSGFAWTWILGLD